MFKFIGGLVCFLLFSLYSSVFSGFAFMHLWAWFVVPIFGLPALSLVASIGLGSVISFYTMRVSMPTKEEELKDNTEEVVEFFILATLKPIIYLAIGYVVHLLM